MLWRVVEFQTTHAAARFDRVEGLLTLAQDCKEARGHFCLQVPAPRSLPAQVLHCNFCQAEPMTVGI